MVVDTYSLPRVDAFVNRIFKLFTFDKTKRDMHVILNGEHAYPFLFCDG